MSVRLLRLSSTIIGTEEEDKEIEEVEKQAWSSAECNGFEGLCTPR